MKKKLIIYGLGQMFQSYYDEKTKRYLSEKYELVGLIDKNSDLLSNIDLEINLYSLFQRTSHLTTFVLLQKSTMMK